MWLSSMVGCSCSPGLLHVPATSKGHSWCLVLFGCLFVQGSFPWGLSLTLPLPSCDISRMHRTWRSERASFRCIPFWFLHLVWDGISLLHSIPMLFDYSSLVDRRGRYLQLPVLVLAYVYNFRGAGTLMVQVAWSSPSSTSPTGGLSGRAAVEVVRVASAAVALCHWPCVLVSKSTHGSTHTY